jgi:hypothetical protein
VSSGLTSGTNGVSFILDTAVVTPTVWTAIVGIRDVGFEYTPTRPVAADVTSHKAIAHKQTKHDEKIRFIIKTPSIITVYYTTKSV